MQTANETIIQRIRNELNNMNSDFWQEKVRHLHEINNVANRYKSEECKALLEVAILDLRILEARRDGYEEVIASPQNIDGIAKEVENRINEIEQKKESFYKKINDRKMIVGSVKMYLKQ